MYLRALRLCSPCFIEEEFTYIKKVFVALGYSNNLIANGLYRAKKTFYSVETRRTGEKNAKVLVLPKCDLKELNILSKDLKIVFKNGLSIGKIVKSKNNLPHIII